MSKQQSIWRGECVKMSQSPLPNEHIQHSESGEESESKGKKNIQATFFSKFFHTGFVWGGALIAMSKK